MGGRSDRGGRSAAWVSPERYTSTTLAVPWHESEFLVNRRTCPAVVLGFALYEICDRKTASRFGALRALLLFEPEASRETHAAHAIPRHRSLMGALSRLLLGRW